MKRFTLFSLCMIFAASSTLFAQRKYDHWSLNLKVGADRGPASGAGILADDVPYGLTFGAEIEWTATPLWGLLFDYSYVAYSNFDIDGTTNEVAGLASVNVSNLLAKYRKGNWQKLNIYGRGGVGLSFYNAEVNGTTVVIPMVAAIEYDISKCIALGLTGEHRWHSSTSMGFNQNLGDQAVMWSALANVRFKFGSSSRSHVRNTTLPDYEAPYAPIYDDAPLKQRVKGTEDNIQQLNDKLGKTNENVGGLGSDVNKLKDDVAKCCAEKNSAASSGKVDIIAQNVEFDFESAQLRSTSYSALNSIVTTMKERSDVKLELVGHTDNTGGERFNEELSMDRALTVYNYLTEKGVDANRLTMKGLGYSKPIATNETAAGRQQNRRVEFNFFK